MSDRFRRDERGRHARTSGTHRGGNRSPELIAKRRKQDNPAPLCVFIFARRTIKKLMEVSYIK